MSEFVVTTSGKLINLDAIAFVTTRVPAEARVTKADSSKTSQVSYVRQDLPRQLVISFSAVTSGEQSVAPLAVVLIDREAADFLDQFAKLRNVDTTGLKQLILAHRGTSAGESKEPGA